jgi:hypothetical protein
MVSVGGIMVLVIIPVAVFIALIAVVSVAMVVAVRTEEGPCCGMSGVLEELAVEIVAAVTASGSVMILAVFFYFLWHSLYK